MILWEEYPDHNVVLEVCTTRLYLTLGLELGAEPPTYVFLSSCLGPSRMTREFFGLYLIKSYNYTDYCTL